MTEVMDFESRLDDLTTAVLMPLRSDKEVNRAALAELRSLVVEIGTSGVFEQTVPTTFAGKLWFVFYSMLDEADHARSNASAIRSAAAGYQESLRTEIFGPRFGR